MKTSKRLLRTRVPQARSRARTQRVAPPHQMRPVIAICSRGDRKRRGQRRKRRQPRRATRSLPRKRKRRRLAKMAMTMMTKGRRRRSPRKPRLRNLFQSQKVATQKTRWRSTRSPRSPRPNRSRNQHRSAKPRRGVLMVQQGRSKRKQETDTRIYLSPCPIFHFVLYICRFSLLYDRRSVDETRMFFPNQEGGF
jgi:hypothetical protein